MRVEQASGPQRQEPQQPGQRNALFTRKRMHAALPGPQPAHCMEPRAPCFIWCANKNDIKNPAPLKTLHRICGHHKVKVVQLSANMLTEPDWAAVCMCGNHSRATCALPARPLPFYNQSEGAPPASQPAAADRQQKHRLFYNAPAWSPAVLISLPKISSWPACRPRPG